MKECVSLRTQINRDANAVDTLQEMLARGRKSCASFHSINFPNDRDWIYRQVGRNQLPLRIPNPTSPPYPSGIDSTKTNREVSRACKFKRTGSLFTRGEPRSNFNVLFKKEKGNNRAIPFFSKRFSRRSILQYPYKLRYEFSAVTRNVNVRYGSRCGYLRGRFQFFTKFRDRHFMRNGTYSNFPAYAGNFMIRKFHN